MKTVLSYIASNIEVIIALTGGIFALFQWREANKNRRAEYLNSLLNKLWENKDIQSFLLLNDYNKHWYNEAFHRSDDKTVSILADKTLSFMNYICYVVKGKMIKKEELNLFDYYLSALAQSSDMRHYMFDLYQYSILNKRTFPFTYFLDTCIKYKLIPEEIKNRNYFKYLMEEESCANARTKYELPPQIKKIRDEFSDHLYLNSCSRCMHCTAFINQACTKGQDTASHFWLPANQDNPCPEFIFDKKDL